MYCRAVILRCGVCTPPSFSICGFAGLSSQWGFFLGVGGERQEGIVLTSVGWSEKSEGATLNGLKCLGGSHTDRIVCLLILLKMTH